MIINVLEIIDASSKDIWNAGKLLSDYTALQPRKYLSSDNESPQVIQYLINIA